MYKIDNDIPSLKPESPTPQKRKQIADYAKGQVKKAVKNGDIIKSSTCEVCDRTGRIEGHHADYNFSLDVLWLCPQCHKDVHRYCEVIYVH